MILIIKYKDNANPDEIIKRICNYSELSSIDKRKRIIKFINIINKCQIEQIINILWIQDNCLISTYFIGYD